MNCGCVKKIRASGLLAAFESIIDQQEHFRSQKPRDLLKFIIDHARATEFVTSPVPIRELKRRLNCPRGIDIYLWHRNGFVFVLIQDSVRAMIFTRDLQTPAVWDDHLKVLDEPGMPWTPLRQT